MTLGALTGRNARVPPASVTNILVPTPVIPEMYILAAWIPYSIKASVTNFLVAMPMFQERYILVVWIPNNLMASLSDILVLTPMVRERFTSVAWPPSNLKASVSDILVLTPMVRERFSLVRPPKRVLPTPAPAPPRSPRAWSSLRSKGVRAMAVVTARHGPSSRFVVRRGGPWTRPGLTPVAHGA